MKIAELLLASIEEQGELSKKEFEEIDLPKRIKRLEDIKIAQRDFIEELGLERLIEAYDAFEYKHISMKEVMEAFIDPGRALINAHSAFNIISNRVADRRPLDTPA